MNSYDILNTHQKFAVIGMSDNPQRYSYRVYYKLKEHHKDVIGINPRLKSVNGEKVYSEIPKGIEIAVLMVNPKFGIDYLETIKDLNIPYLWIQPGAESQEILDAAKHLDITVIESCVLREYKAKEIKMVVSDLDETLLNDDRQISELNLNAINTLKEKGIVFIPASGRPYYSMKNTVEALQLKGETDFVISFNGGMIHKPINDEILSITALDHDLADTLYQFGLKQGLCVHVYIEKDTYVSNINDVEKQHLKHFPGGYSEIDTDTLDFLKDTPILKVIYQDLDFENLKRIESILDPQLKAHLEISYSSNRYMEINPKGVSKGNALKYIANHLDISLKDILAIGDNLNDLSMLEIAGLSGAPANARDAILDVVIYKSPRTYNQSAVYDILRLTKVI